MSGCLSHVELAVESVGLSRNANGKNRRVGIAIGGGRGISSADGVAERCPCSISLDVMNVKLPNWPSSQAVTDTVVLFAGLDDLVNTWESFDRLDGLVSLL